MTKLFSYVVDHDHGKAPHPSGRYCTLAKCKYGSKRYKNIIELAKEGDWIVGTGGVDPCKSAGHGKLIYAMRVDEKLALADYCKDKRFSKRLDAKHDLPTRGRYALISRHFFYFGRKAKKIPARFLAYPLEKTEQGFRNHFSEEDIKDFTEWLEDTFPLGVNGPPCQPHPEFSQPTCTSKAKRKGCAR